MGVGLNLTGKLPKASQLEPWFNEVWDWLSDEFPGMATGAGLGKGPFDEFLKIDLRFHPAADPVKIWFSDPTTIHLLADTVSAGPGYHLFVCDILWAISEKFGINWDQQASEDHQNPTFFSGDPEEAYREMFAWLGSMATSASAMQSGEGNFHLSMPPSYQFFSKYPLITPMGPRSHEWLKEVSKSPAKGADVFPWLEPGIGAKFLLNRALTHMWSDIRWCPPLGDGDEALMRTVLALLREAAKQDPSLDYPWREWAELLSYLQIKDDLTAVVNKHAKNAKATEPIGYRRGKVRAALDQGWTAILPGSYSESATYDPSTHNHTWQYSGDDLMIWVTTYPTYGDEQGNIMPIEEAVKELDELEANIGKFVEEDKSGKILRRIFMTAPEKQEAWRFSALFLVPGRLALSHVFSQNKSDMDKAMEFFKSIDNTAGTSTRYIEQPRVPRLDLVACY